MKSIGRRGRGRSRRVHLSVYNLFEPAVEWEFLVCGLSCVTVIKKMTWDVCENRTGVNLYWKKRKRKSWASSDIVAKHSNRQGKNLEVTWQGTNDKQWDEINEGSCISLCAIRGQRVSYGPCYPCSINFINICWLCIRNSASVTSSLGFEEPNDAFPFKVVPIGRVTFHCMLKWDKVKS